MSPKTTATVEHLDYVPWGCTEEPFCRVSFEGAEAAALQQRWDAVTAARFAEYDAIVQECEQSIRRRREQIQAIEAATKRPWYRLRYTLAEKQQRAKIQDLRDEVGSIELFKIENGKKRFYSTYEYRSRLEKLLLQNGFYPVASGSTGEGAVVHTELWVKD